MKRLAATLLFLVAAVPSLAAETLQLADLAGEWIDAKYAEALRETRSPLAAAKRASPTAFSLRQEKGQWRLFATSFHEGYWRIAVRLVPKGGGKYDLMVGENEVADAAKTHPLHLTAERRDGQWLVSGPIFDEESPGTYRRIAEPAERWANRFLLAGRYTDARGRAYTFSDDGTATFPDQPPFHYDVVLDTSEACCDYVNTSRKHRGQYEDRIAYRRRGETLELYDVLTNPDDASGCPISRAKEPFAVLQPFAAAVAQVAAPAADFTELDRAARQFQRNFAAGRFEAASKDFNAQMRATVTPAVLGDLKRQVEQQLGIFLTIGSLRHEQTAQGVPVVEVIARYAKGPASLKVAFDERNHIASLELSPIAEEKPDPKLETEARELLTDFSEGRFDAVAKRFEPALRAQLPPPRLEQLARQVEATYGKFVSVTGARYGTGNGQTTVELLTVYENAPVSVRVVFDGSKRVAGLKIARTQKR